MSSFRCAVILCSPSGGLWYPLIPSFSLWFPLIPSSSLWLPLVPSGSLWCPLASGAAVSDKFIHTGDLKKSVMVDPLCGRTHFRGSGRTQTNVRWIVVLMGLYCRPFRCPNFQDLYRIEYIQLSGLSLESVAGYLLRVNNIYMFVHFYWHKPRHTHR